MITARGLHRRFAVRGGTVDAVRGVDLDIQPGEIAAFLGPNGAGKTTTARMLTTLLRPSGGTATVAGRDLLTDPLGVRRRIGAVAQGHGSSADARVGEQVELQARLYGLAKAEARRRTAWLLGELDLDGLYRREAKALSGGQRRRLDLALGLVHRPSLVFLDEPTTGLDPQSRANLWAHIRWLRRDHGVTVFLTTHYLDEADALADRVFVMDHGRIVARGTPAQLKSSISGDWITIRVQADHMRRAMAVVYNFSAAREVTCSGDQLCFSTPRGDTVLPALLRNLELAAVTTTAVEVRTSTLDDVFLTLTGRNLRDTPAPGGAKEADRVA
ncbi:ATP-binding cassette domain-containing protein [Kibdelosporangium aridum]|uniref:ATP-binding cassette domain-containing protein n=1 Tax=Kibdelosporangium aridum TaxID=2030 RepID=UPI000525D722